MKKTCLNQWHIDRGASMTDFNGWHMPLFYKGITQEHAHTRTKTGLFDLGHMGRVFLRGPHARSFVDHLTPAKVSEAKPGDIQYSFLLREDGTVIDDITVYYDDHEVLLVVNAGNRERDFSWIQDQASAFAHDVEVDDRGETWSMIAVQGPGSGPIIEKIFGEEPARLGYYRFIRLNPNDPDNDVIISRTGYTGEDGYEIYLPKDKASDLWDKVLAAAPEGDVEPVGLGARDSLRLEAAMPLYGHELDDSLTPLHAGLSRFVDMNKPNFIGRAALASMAEAGGPDSKLVGFEMQQRGPVARQGFPVLDAEGNTIGHVTSGIFSPTLQKTVGLAYVKKEHSSIGNSISIEIRGRALPATIVKRPFYRRKA